MDLMVLIGEEEKQVTLGYPPHQSAPSNPALHILPALYKATKNAKPLHIHPEDVCRNAG
jgi:hypothetical protein